MSHDSIIRSTNMDDHVTEEPPKDDKEKAWLHDDARSYIQIKNFIDRDVVGLIDHCDFVKELLELLDFLYSEKKNKLIE